MCALLAACFGALGAPAVAPTPVAAAEDPSCEWLAGDFHVHTTYSHDSWDPVADDNTGPDEFYTLGWSVPEEAQIGASRDLDFLAITDHSDVRSTSPANRAAIEAQGLIAVPGYENSLPGHAQFVGVPEVLDNGDKSVQRLKQLKHELHQRDGFFQINHPSDLDWINHYGGPDGTTDEKMARAVEVFQPDSLEVWNISPGVWQPPLPASNDDDFSLRFYDEFLTAGYRVAATGGSDSHWRTTTAAQGVGQPTTWVCASEPTAAGITEGVRSSRTTLSSQPPGYGGAFLTMTADGDGDGRYETRIGDETTGGAAVRARVAGAAGAVLDVIADGEVVRSFQVSSPDQTFEFNAPAEAGYIRAEAYYDDAPEVRAELQPLCDTLGSTHCQSRFAMAALTSPIYLTEKHQNGSTYVIEQDGAIAIGNGLVERTFGGDETDFGTVALLDKRSGHESTRFHDLLVELSDPIGGVDTIATDGYTGHEVSKIDRGIRLTLHYDQRLAQVDRIIDVYNGVAGFASRTRITPKVPLAVGSAWTDAFGASDSPATSHAFRAGADWREPGWGGPDGALGNPHAGTWRETKTAGTFDEPAQWLSAPNGTGSLFVVLERNDLPSSRARYSVGNLGMVGVNYAHDIVSAGPFEESVHAENPVEDGPQNPGAPAGRHRVHTSAFSLPRVFMGLGTSPEDENWQFFKYLTEHRMAPYDFDVTFNSNGTDSNRISTGAKDDMDYDTVLEVAPLARRLGIETFILDDGWQAISGDWCPDSPGCRDPQRFDPTAPQEGFWRFPPRFPDGSFSAVREAIAPMKLGLWMNAMHFHPASQTFQQHPEWNCHPTSDALVAYNAAEPNSSSNEAGLATWSPLAIPHVESKIRTAIEDWGARYFKFDFLVWLDCAGSDMWSYKDEFAAMLDRLSADYEHVTFQIDETNDYRLFPFESIVRGPSWFQNGSPEPHQLLHNIHNLSPWIPAFSLGQHFLGGGQYERYPVDTLMAVALTSHLTFFSELRTVPLSVIDQARPWIDFYKAHRENFTQMIHPLLADPMEQEWTALQSWNPEEGFGALLAFRQKDTAATQTIALKQVPAGMTFRLIEAPSGEVVGTYTSAQLVAGLDVTIPAPDGARVFVIEPLS